MNRGFGHAIAALEQALETAETNAPINAADGNTAQAALERDVARDIRDALDCLRGLSAV